MAVAITPEQLRAYWEDGYFVLENVFTSDKIQAIGALIEAHHERTESRLAEVGTEGISRTGEIAFTPFLAEQDEGLRAFVKRPEFVAITTAILGPDVDLYWNQAVYKGPDGSAQFPWHQDDGYTKVEPSPYLTLWLAINDATPENGCISVLPGSHKQGLVKHEQTPIGLACHSLDDPDQGVLVPVALGSMAAFQSLTMHKSGVNRSSGMRKAYIVQYSVAGLRDANTGEPFENRIPIARGGIAV